MQWARWKLAQIVEDEAAESAPASMLVVATAGALGEAMTEAVDDVSINVRADAPAPVEAVPPRPAAGRTSTPPGSALVVLPPDEAAAVVFSDFQGRVAPLMTATDWNSDALHKRELEIALHDPRLTHLAARDYFEWHVARTLAAGWRPGHEALLVAAARVFNWNQDRRGLVRFGQTGDILNRSLDERAIYDQQPEVARTLQRNIIARLRDPARPSYGELINKLAIADAILGRYPTWVPLVTNMENLKTWHLLDREVPGWRRNVADKVKWLRDLHPVQKWLAAVLIASALSTTCNGAHRAAPLHPNQRSDAATFVDSNQAAQAEYTTRYRRIIEGSPTAEKCQDAADYIGFNSLASGIGFGPEFDDRVVACARYGFWPMRPASISILQMAEGRVRQRNTESGSRR